MREVSIEAADRDLTRSIDAAMSRAARLAGDWLVCRIGCTGCCTGPFAITGLDALRLRRGLSELNDRDPGRALKVRNRAAAYVERYAAWSIADLLEQSPADDDPCPALDPESGACDLYEYRPVTCRVFGPPVAVQGDTLAVCELCFQGATDEQIAACRVAVDTEGREAELLVQIRELGAPSDDTLVAHALAPAGGVS